MLLLGLACAGTSGLDGMCLQTTGLPDDPISDWTVTDDDPIEDFSDDRPE